MIREHSSGVAGILDNDRRPHDIGIHFQYSDSTRIYLYQEFFRGKDRTGFLPYEIGPVPDFGVIITSLMKYTGYPSSTTLQIRFHTT